jgi:transposase
MQEQIENLIKYITQDKMTVKEASAKVNLTYNSCRYYYAKYLKDPNHTIPVPSFKQIYTQEQRDAFLGYIINDKMSIRAASKKAKMAFSVSCRYYHKYFEVHNPDFATPSHIATPRCFTQEQIKEVIGYIVDDKMSINAASRKANVCNHSTRNYYRQYLKDNRMEMPVSKMGKRYTQDEINEFIGYIVDDKMSIKAASKKANMCESTGRKYYGKYLKEHNIDDPSPKYVTRDQINQVVGYIVDDKMSITAASKKANKNPATGRKYHHQHLNDQKRDAPTRPQVNTRSRS